MRDRRRFGASGRDERSGDEPADVERSLNLREGLERLLGVAAADDDARRVVAMRCCIIVVQGQGRVDSFMLRARSRLLPKPLAQQRSPTNLALQ